MHNDVAPLKSILSNRDIKNLYDREILFWKENNIHVNKVILNYNYKNTNLCFYAPVLSKYKFNWFKEVLRNSITFESSIGHKSLITLYRQAGVLVLFVNQSKLTILDQELQMNRLTSMDDLLVFLDKIGLKTEPKVEVKTIPTNYHIEMKRNKSKKIKSENSKVTTKTAASSIVDLQLWHKINGTKINIKDIREIE